MKSIRPLFRLLIILATILQCTQPSDQSSQEPYVVLVSFDGFRHDYVERWQLPNFQKLITQGAQSGGLIPSYPSKTFPNHYTLVTGLLPGNHGLVDNQFYDRSKKAIYRMSDRSKVEDPDFYGGLPLWQLAQQSGIKTASYFWVGSEAPIAGSWPTYYKIYDGSVPNLERINQVLDWLQLPAIDRPRFITLYFSLVDSKSHQHGPLADQTEQSVREADRLLGRLMDQIQELDLPINLMVTSDHGMFPLSLKKESYLDLSALTIEKDSTTIVINSGTQVQFYISNPDKVASTYAALKRQENHFKVMKKEETPEAWGYRSHQRIGQVLLIAENGFEFRNKISGTIGSSGTDTVGVHGYYASQTPDLWGIFYALGPNIISGSKIPAFDNIHVFPLVTQILGLRNPEGIDGKAEVLQAIYQE